MFRKVSFDNILHISFYYLSLLNHGVLSLSARFYSESVQPLITSNYIRFNILLVFFVLLIMN